MLRRAPVAVRVSAILFLAGPAFEHGRVAGHVKDMAPLFVFRKPFLHSLRMVHA